MNPHTRVDGSNTDEDDEYLGDHLACHNNGKSERMNDGGSNDSANDIGMDEHRCEKGHEAVNHSSISHSAADDTAPYTVDKSSCKARNNTGGEFYPHQFGASNLYLPRQAYLKNSATIVSDNIYHSINTNNVGTGAERNRPANTLCGNMDCTYEDNCLTSSKVPSMFRYSRGSNVMPCGSKEMPCTASEIGSLLPSQRGFPQVPPTILDSCGYNDMPCGSNGIPRTASEIGSSNNNFASVHDDNRSLGKYEEGTTTYNDCGYSLSFSSLPTKQSYPTMKLSKNETGSIYMSNQCNSQCEEYAKGVADSLMTNADRCNYPNNVESVFLGDGSNSVSSLSSNMHYEERKSYPPVPSDLLPKALTGIYPGYCQKHWSYGQLFNKALPIDFSSASPEDIACYDDLLKKLYVFTRNTLIQGLSKRIQTIVTEHGDQYGLDDSINGMDTSKIQGIVIDHIGYSIFDQTNAGKVNTRMLALIMRVCKLPYTRDTDWVEKVKNQIELEYRFKIEWGDTKKDNFIYGILSQIMTGHNQSMRNKQKKYAYAWYDKSVTQKVFGQGVETNEMKMDFMVGAFMVKGYIYTVSSFSTPDPYKTSEYVTGRKIENLISASNDSKDFINKLTTYGMDVWNKQSWNKASVMWFFIC